MTFFHHSFFNSLIHSCACILFSVTDEDIVDAVKREVLEETGIQTKFVSLICFRHMLNFRFGCSDVYFICHLKPLTQDIDIEPREIADAQWMDVSEVITCLAFFHFCI